MYLIENRNERNWHKIKYIIDFSRVRNARLAKNVVYAVFNLCENAATRGWRNRKKLFEEQ